MSGNRERDHDPMIAYACPALVVLAAIGALGLAFWLFRRST